MRAMMAFLRNRDVVARRGGVALLDQAIASLTNFSAGVIIGRVCTKDEFGLYMLGLSLVLLLTSVQDMFVTTPYMVFSPRLQGEHRARYNGSTLIHQLVLSLLAAAGLGVAGGVLFLEFAPARLAPVLVALAVVLVFILTRNYIRRLCFAALRMRSALAIDFAVGVVQVGGLLLLAWLHLLSADRAFAVLGAACGVGSLAWLLGNRRSFVVRLDHTKADFARNWSFGKWILASGLLWDVGMSLYPWILGWFHGAEAIGVWAACLGIVSMGNPAFLGVQNYLGPQIMHCRAEGGNGALYRFVLRSSATFGGLVLVFSVFLMVCANWLVVFVYGEKYAGNSLVVCALAMNLVVTACGFSLSRGLLALERADVDFAINAVAVVLLLTVGLWLVQSWGAAGAAAGMLLTNAVIAVAKYAAFLSLCGPVRSPAA